MEMNKYAGLFDELEKIAEEQQKYVTKEKFKRHLKTLVPVAIGAGLGTASGYAALEGARRHGKKINRFLAKHPKVARGIPAALGAAGAAAGMLRRAKDKKIREYIEGK